MLIRFLNLFKVLAFGFAIFLYFLLSISLLFVLSLFFLSSIYLVSLALLFLGAQDGNLDN